MKDLLQGYSRPSENEFSEMWQKGIFAFDGNMVLNVYRYSPRLQQRFFDVLEKLKSRIWVPHQAALEYRDKRLDVILDQHEVYKEIEDLFAQTVERLKGKKHLFIDIDEIVRLFTDAIEKSRGVLEEAQVKHPDFLAYDPHLERITDLFNGRVGSPFPDDELAKIHEEAKRRIKEHIPPGYKDASKEGSRPYGDIVLWLQLL